MKYIVIIALFTVCGLIFNPVTGAFAATFLVPSLTTGFCALSYNRSFLFWSIIGLVPGIGLALFCLTLTLTEKKFSIQKNNFLYPQMG